MRHLVLAFACAMFIVRPSEAQPRVELYGVFGYGHVTEDDGFLGDGAEFGGGARFFLNDRIFFPVEVVHQRIGTNFERLVAFDDPASPTGLPFFVSLDLRLQGGATFYMTGIGRRFLSGAVKPSITGEVGFMHYGGLESSVENEGAIPDRLVPQEPLTGRTDGTNTVFVGSTASLWFQTGERWHVQSGGGLRFAATGNLGPKYILRIHVSGGVSW
jgi:hypothetical protein